MKSLNVQSYSKRVDLIPYTIGISRGWANNPEFDAANYLKKETATNQILNVRKFLKKRVDMLAISFKAFRYEITTIEESTVDDVVFLQAPFNISKLHLMVPERELIISEFNQGLAEIKQDGAYEKRLQEYGF